MEKTWWITIKGSSVFVERYEKSFGRVNPMVIAEKSPRYSSNQSAVELDKRNKFLAFLLMD